jgi:hypothetical protein
LTPWCTEIQALRPKSKDINDAGHALHADYLEAAAKYNLKIVYRRGASKAAAPRPAPTPGK